jgi:hypothetical protein
LHLLCKVLKHLLNERISKRFERRLREK